MWCVPLLLLLFVYIHCCWCCWCLLLLFNARVVFKTLWERFTYTDFFFFRYIWLGTKHTTAAATATNNDDDGGYDDDDGGGGGGDNNAHISLARGEHSNLKAKWKKEQYFYYIVCIVGTQYARLVYNSVVFITTITTEKKKKKKKTWKGETKCRILATNTVADVSVSLFFFSFCFFCSQNNLLCINARNV